VRLLSIRCSLLRRPKSSAAVTAIATTQNHHSQILTRHSELLEKILDTQHNYGSALNAIDGRLTLIEKHTGLVKTKPSASPLSK
jgi:hypothetical protein